MIVRPSRVWVGSGETHARECREQARGGKQRPAPFLALRLTINKITGTRGQVFPPLTELQGKLIRLASDSHERAGKAFRIWLDPSATVPAVTPKVSFFILRFPEISIDGKVHHISILCRSISLNDEVCTSAPWSLRNNNKSQSNPTPVSWKPLSKKSTRAIN